MELSLVERMGSVLQREALSWTGVAVLAAIGFWFRVRRLGSLGLVVDEGGQALAVQGILKQGVPKLDSGLIYPRSLLFLYIQAASARLFGLNEFSLRLPGVLVNVAAIFATYALGKTILGAQVGFLAALLMTFSVWEIELSRYARSYTAFQLLFVLALLSFYRGFIGGEQVWKFCFVATSIIAFGIHELSLIFAFLFLILFPLTAYSAHSKFIFGALAVGLAALWLLYHWSFRLFKELPGTLLNYSESGDPTKGILEKIRDTITARIDIPRLVSVRKLAREKPRLFWAFTLVPGIGSGYLLYCFLYQNSGWSTLIVISILWAAFLHQFSFVLILLTMYVVFFVKDFSVFGEPKLQVLYIVVGVCCAVWVAFFAHLALPLKRVAKKTFGYPRMGSYFFSWFTRGWPVLTVVVIAGTIMLLARFVADRGAPAPLFLPAALFLPVFLTCLLRLPFYEARYTFHLYPVMVLIFAAVCVEIGINLIQTLQLGKQLNQDWIMIAIAAGALFISQDANPFEAWRVGNRRHSSRKDPIKGHVNWDPYSVFHQDHKSPSLFVQSHLVPGDRVVVLGAVHMLGVYRYYLGRIDHAILRPQDSRYILRSKDGERLDYLTGTAVLQSLAEVKEVTERSCTGRIWLLGDRPFLEQFNTDAADPLKQYIRCLTGSPDYLGLDGRTFAAKLQSK